MSDLLKMFKKNPPKSSKIVQIPDMELATKQRVDGMNKIYKKFTPDNAKVKDKPRYEDRF